jgi:hypothetical protein
MLSAALANIFGSGDDGTTATTTTRDDASVATEERPTKRARKDGKFGKSHGSGPKSPENPKSESENAEKQAEGKVTLDAVIRSHLAMAQAELAWLKQCWHDADEAQYSEALESILKIANNKPLDDPERAVLLSCVKVSDGFWNQHRRRLAAQEDCVKAEIAKLEKRLDELVDETGH